MNRHNLDPKSSALPNYATLRGPLPQSLPSMTAYSGLAVWGWIAWDLNPEPFGYEPNALTIAPAIPFFCLIGGVSDFSYKSVLSFSPDMKTNPLPWSFILPASRSLSCRFGSPCDQLASQHHLLIYSRFTSLN